MPFFFNYLKRDENKTKKANATFQKNQLSRAWDGLVNFIVVDVLLYQMQIAEVAVIC